MYVVGYLLTVFGQRVTDAVRKYYIPAAFQGCRDTEFKLAELGNDAGIYGAVKMVL